jgi:hypothetical protein
MQTELQHRKFRGTFPDRAVSLPHATTYTRQTQLQYEQPGECQTGYVELKIASSHCQSTFM